MSGGSRQQEDFRIGWSSGSPSQAAKNRLFVVDLACLTNLLGSSTKWIGGAQSAAGVDGSGLSIWAAGGRHREPPTHSSYRVWGHNRKGRSGRSP